MWAKQKSNGQNYHLEILLCIIFAPVLHDAIRYTNTYRNLMHEVTESQNQLGWARHLRSSSPTYNQTTPCQLIELCILHRKLKDLQSLTIL